MITLTIRENTRSIIMKTIKKQDEVKLPMIKKQRGFMPLVGWVIIAAAGATMSVGASDKFQKHALIS